MKRYSDSEILNLVKSQLRSLYPIGGEVDIIDRYYAEAMDRTLYCFDFNTNKYYHTKDGEVYFDPLHTCQYFCFLYFLANTIYKKDKSTEAIECCDKLYGLSKTLLACDLYYQVDLPKIWFCDHPYGSGIGRAEYGDGFFFSQGCLVGNNNGIYPEIGENVRMLSDSKILGNCHIGNNVTFAANSYIKDMDIPDNSIVFGQYPNNIIKQKK